MLTQVLRCPRHHVIDDTATADGSGDCDKCGGRIVPGEKILECRLCEPFWWCCEDCLVAGSALAPSQPLFTTTRSAGAVRDAGGKLSIAAASSAAFGDLLDGGGRGAETGRGSSESEVESSSEESDAASMSPASDDQLEIAEISSLAEVEILPEQHVGADDSTGASASATEATAGALLGSNSLPPSRGGEAGAVPEYGAPYPAGSSYPSGNLPPKTGIPVPVISVAPSFLRTVPSEPELLYNAPDSLFDEVVRIEAERISKPELVQNRIVYDSVPY